MTEKCLKTYLIVDELLIACDVSLERFELDKRFYQIIIGLALQNELYNQRYNQKLHVLFSNPNYQQMKKLYLNLINSQNHYDRETAFWLELAVQQNDNQTELNIARFLNKLNKMELLLYNVLWKVDPESQRDFNEWVNYIANMSESVRERNWIDAKIFSNQAYYYSKKETIERNKMKQELKLQIESLQRATLHCFEEITRIHSNFAIPFEHLDLLSNLQKILIELLQKCHLSSLCKNHGSVSRIIQLLNTAQKRLFNLSCNMTEINEIVSLAIEYLTDHIKNVTNTELKNWLCRLKINMESLILKEGRLR